MKIRPKMGEVLVRMDRPESQTESGILLAPEAPEPAVTGVVLRCGIWRVNSRGSLIPHPVQRGDKVVVSHRSGRWCRGEELRLKLIPEKKILAVITHDFQKD
jgi:co-chaperonin GroES (HSP10)